MTERARFEPRFTLSLVYLFGFFFLFCLLFAAPALFEVWREVPPGPEQQAAAERAARAALGGRVLPAFVAALLTVAGLTYANALPGMRRR
jgi:ABC-type sulfate transport system permease component